MKNYKTIAELKELYNQCVAEVSTENAYERESRWRAEWRKTESEDMDSPEIKALIERQNAEQENIKFNEEVMLIIKNNVRVLMKEELLPIIVETLNKYSGKRAGEKTKAKIRAEIEEQCVGYSIWFTDRNIYINDKEFHSFKLEINTEYQKGITIDNVIQDLNIDQFYCYGLKPMITDSPHAWINARKHTAASLAMEYKELELRIGEYNKKYGIEGQEDLHIKSDNLHFYY